MNFSPFGTCAHQAVLMMASLSSQPDPSRGTSVRQGPDPAAGTSSRVGPDPARGTSVLKTSE